MQHIVLGTAGHIDHGKTALVRALTGIDTDRLDEERRRGITIELGFAPWHIGETLEASIIDVPGHERLVRTMVAGAAGMDLAMLVVATDDGVMPQTREHVDVLRLLGVPAGVVVLTKCDLVDEELLGLVQDELEEALRGSVFEGAPVVRTSAKTGIGIKELGQVVLQRASTTQRRSSEGAVFLPIDRVFHRPGHGTIVTGTTLRGSVSVGDHLDLFDTDRKPTAELKVRGLQALGANRQSAKAGMRTAINVVGKGVEHISRGAVVASAGAFIGTPQFTAWVHVLEHATVLKEETLSLHIGTCERPANVVPLGDKSIAPGAAGGVLLRLKTPVCAYAGQRLVLRRPGVRGQATVAGGEVLDPEPPEGKGAVSLAASVIQQFQQGPQDRVLALCRQSRAAGVTRSALHRRLAPGKGEQAAGALTQQGVLWRIDGREPMWIDGQVGAKVSQRLLDLVTAHHETSPLSAGLPEAELESQLPAPERHLASPALHRLIADGILVRNGPIVGRKGYGMAVDAEAQRDMDAMAQRVADGGLMPPTDSEIAATMGLQKRRVQELMKLLERQGRISRVSDAVHYDAQVLKALRDRIVAGLVSGQEITATEFKELAGGVSRKWAIPLLEYFDRQKVTIRIGDIRRLHPRLRTQ